MIGVDTSTLVAYFSGEKAKDTDFLHTAILERIAVVAPVVLTELCSGPQLTAEQKHAIEQFDIFSINDGYWTRAGLNRRIIKLKQKKAKLGDALIAQCCIDHRAPLLSRDEDFRHYAEHCGLKLVDFSRH